MSQLEQHMLKISITRYRDKNMEETCASDFTNGDVCVFYRTAKFGTDETCLFLEYQNNKKTLERRGNGEGSLVPFEGCPVWRPKLSISNSNTCDCREAKMIMICKSVLRDHDELQRFKAGFGKSKPCTCETCKTIKELYGDL